MTFALYLPAVLALLIAPGPTNTLVTLAGAQAGMRRVAGLLPAEIAGYLCAILPAALLGTAAFARWPWAAPALRIAAALWVAGIAVRLWRAGPGAAADAPRPPIAARTVFLTTLLNPKALVVALVLLPPPGDALFAPWLAAFVGAVALVAAGWGAAGSLARLGDGGAARIGLVGRVASVWLAAVSLGLTASVVHG